MTMIPLRDEVDFEAMEVIAKLQRAVLRLDGAEALSVCQQIDRMTRDGQYLALAKIDWSGADDVA